MVKRRNTKEAVRLSLAIFSLLLTCRPSDARVGGGQLANNTRLTMASSTSQGKRTLSGISNASRHLIEDGENSYLLTNSDAFRFAFGALLVIIVLVRVGVVVSLIRFRKRPTLQLAQSPVLAVLVLMGAISIGSCYLLLPVNSTHCYLRDVLIFTPLTLAGNILAGRVWRIRLLMTPVLQVGTHSGNHIGMYEIVVTVLVDLFTTLADSGEVLFGIFQKRKDSRMHMRQRSRLRQQVSIFQLVWLITILSSPQIILQACKLAMPEFHEVLVWQDIFHNSDLDISVKKQCCQSASGRTWPTWVGMLLTIIPYIFTVFLSLETNHLPKIFNEAAAVIRSVKSVALALAVATPSYFMALLPDAKVYLGTMMVFAVAMPPCWFIVYSKLWNQWVIDHSDDHSSEKGESGKSRRSTFSRLLRQRRNSLIQTSTRIGKKTDIEKSAKLALTIGKMYEDMGLVQKSIHLFDEALAVWECDPARDGKEKIGGFTQDEINSFSCSDLEYIIQLLIAKGRVNGTFNSAVDTGQKNAAQAWLDALEIYERAPARTKVEDRSIIFPIFSGLFVFLKGGKITQDAHCNFEQNLVRKFVRETKLQGDPIHYTRALAMQCEVKGRLGQYNGALETFDKLKAIYDPEAHSEGVSAAYGTDRSAQAFSQAALWHLQLDDENQAVEACDSVLVELIPMMDPKNVLNICELLLPIIRIFKPRGESLRMRELFDKHVVQNFLKHFGKDGVTPCLPIFKPLLMLLDMCHDPMGFPDFDEALTWLLEEDNGVPPDFLDSVYVKLCWSPNDMLAELCLRVANRLIDTDGEFAHIQTLVKKGLRLSRKAHRKIVDNEGKIILPIAHGIHEPTYDELRDIATVLGIMTEESEHFIANTKTSDPTKHLPRDYMKSFTSSLSDDNSGSFTNSLRNLRKSRSSESLRSLYSQQLKPSSVIQYESANVSENSSTSGKGLREKVFSLGSSTGRMESSIAEAGESVDGTGDSAADDDSVLMF